MTITNKEFTKDLHFLQACRQVAKHAYIITNGKIALAVLCLNGNCDCGRRLATKRQASKFRNKKGRVYKQLKV